MGSNRATITAPGWRPWTAYEERLLERMKAADADPETLKRTFPGRTWLAIERKRNRVGPRPSSDARQRPTYPAACLVIRALTARRRELKLSRKALAALLERHPSTVERWEQGRAEPEWRTLISWAEALGMMIVAKSKG